MADIQFVITLVVFIATIAGGVLLLRADARSQRREGRDELRTAIRESDERQNQRMDAVEARLNQRMDTLQNALLTQMQANHRELLLRLAFHHHGDGRYPVVPSTDPDPVDPTGGN